MPRIQLTAEQARQLRDAEAQFKEMAAELARAKRAGLDVRTQEAQLKTIDNLRKGLLTEYAPKPPLS